MKTEEETFFPFWWISLKFLLIFLPARSATSRGVLFLDFLRDFLQRMKM